MTEAVRDSDSEDESGSSTEEEMDDSDEEKVKRGKKKKKRKQKSSSSDEEVARQEEIEIEDKGEEKNDEERNKVLEKLKVDEFPDKVKSLVFKCCGKFVSEEKKEAFMKDMERELRGNEEQYSKSSDNCVRGLKKLVLAGQEGMKAMAFAIETVRDVIERVRRLRKFKKEVDELEPRVEVLKDSFLQIELEYYEEDFEENLERLFEEMKVLKDDFDDLLGRLRNFKLSVKIRWRLAGAFLAGALGTGIVLFVGGAFTTILGAGCFLTTLLTEGLALPVALTLYGLSILGVFSGVATCLVTMLASLLVFGSATVQHLSCKASLKKAKKLIKKIKGHKSEAWFSTMENMMEMIKEEEKSKAGIMKDVEEFVKVYQKKYMRPDDEEEEEEDVSLKKEEEEEEESEEEGEDTDEEEDD